MPTYSEAINSNETKNKSLPFSSLILPGLMMRAPPILAPCELTSLEWITVKSGQEDVGGQ